MENEWSWFISKFSLKDRRNLQEALIKFGSTCNTQGKGTGKVVPVI